MILVDSSVWIDYFKGVPTPQTDMLDLLLGYEPILIGDLILLEVLQGFSKQSDFNKAQELLGELEAIELGGIEIARKGAQYYRKLRAKGITVRKTMDVVIAARCIENKLELLHDDRDFLPFTEHFGLRTLL